MNRRLQPPVLSVSTNLHRPAARTVLAGISCAMLLTTVAAPVSASSAAPPSRRVAALIAAMTLDEKLSFVSPAVDPADRGQAGFLPGVPRLGIPELRLTDGPAGVRLRQPATALPVPVALASSFDPALAREYGQVIAREGRALGQDVILSPMANIIRVPQGGRNYETFSEDPYLTSRIVAAQVGGIAAAGV